MLSRLTNYRPIETLHTLAEVVRPITSGARRNNRNYTIETPLNRLVDATLPESETARWFIKMVKTFLVDRTDQSAYYALRTQLGIWRDIRDRLEPELQRSSLLAEAEPLAAMLSKVAEIGLLSLKALHNEGSSSNNAREGHLELLEQATSPIAELRFMIVPGIKELVEAISTDGLA